MKANCRLYCLEPSESNAIVIDNVVNDMRGLVAKHGVELSVEIGRLILDRLYGGDVQRWRYRGNKDISFRKLQHHPRLPFSAAHLSRAVMIYMLSRRKPELMLTRNLGPSHLHELAGLPEEEQDRIFDLAERECWSVKQIREVVGESRLKQRGKLTSIRRIVQILRLLDKWARDGSFTFAAEAFRGVELIELRELLAIARSSCHRLENLTRILALQVGEREHGDSLESATEGAVATSQH